MNTSMMTAIPHAAVPASPAPAATRQLRPLVFIEGRCAPELTVAQYDAAGALDTRRASIHGPRPTGDPRITIALPATLHDGAVQWRVLADGHSSAIQRTVQAQTDSGGFEVLDDWASVLERTLSADEQRDLMALTTCGQILDWLTDAAVPRGENPVIARVSDAERFKTLMLSSTEAVSIGTVWLAVTEQLNRYLQTSLSRIAGEVRRVTRLLPAEHGRPIALPWARAGVGRVTAMRSQSGTKRARKWTALGARPRLEDTFTLAPAWDPSLQAQPDDDYDAALSSDFSRFGRVFRAWVLNEDAAYDGPVYDTAAAFDLNQPDREPLVLTDCLASDATGRALLPVVEFSTDGGASWARYTGALTVMSDRAGLVLEAPTLPTGLVDSGQAGLLQLRVTATLIGPAPITAERWAGNPFLGTTKPIILDRSTEFGWQRVGPDSLHAAAIDNGTLTAEVRDDRPALLQTLLQHMGSADEAGGMTIELIGAWPDLRAGDRVIDPMGEGVGQDGVPTVLGGEPGVIEKVRVRFGTQDQEPGTRVLVG